MVFITFYRSTSGGHFNVSANTYEYRDKFKKSLRSYERSNSKHNPPRPAFSAIMGNRKINSKFDRRFLQDMNLAKVKVNNALRQSLDIKGKPVEGTLNNNYLANTQTEVTDDAKIYSDEFENQASPNHVLAKSPRMTLVTDPSRDILTESQSTYPRQYVVTQTRMSRLQRGMDKRLSIPKHQRLRIEGPNIISLNQSDQSFK